MAVKITAIRWILVILNTLLPVLGIALIAASLHELHVTQVDSLAQFTIIIQIFIGAFVLLSAFLGCFATCRTSLGLTCSYGICLLILLAFHVYIIIIAINGNHTVEQEADYFKMLWSNRTLHMQKIADIQQKFHCCGYNGPHDYVLLGTAIPQSCYENNTHKGFTEGCLEISANAVENVGETWPVFVKWALFFIELLALSFACLLATAIHNQQRRAKF